MMMTEPDIAKEFREAKNKSEQIETLAIMNLLTEDEVVAILVRNGIARASIPKKYKKCLEQPEVRIVVPDSVKRALQMRIVELDSAINRTRKTIEEHEKELAKLKAERSEVESFVEGSVDYYGKWTEKQGS